ncbi:MAG: GSU2403 family nucleotidyltransferase fold protein [Pseudomonadota bacterium]
MDTMRPFTDEQTRCLINTRQRYDAWITAEQQLRELPYDLRKKRIAGADYLYEIYDRGGNGRSLGRWSAARQADFENYREKKQEVKRRIAGAKLALDETTRMYRALRLPLLASEAGAILREADRRALLGSHLIVVGTNALPAYMIEAAASFDVPDETEHFDLAWAAEHTSKGEPVVWDLLKSVDATFTVNSERRFQVRNAKAYEVELLVAPSRASSLARTDQPRPMPLAEQEWLLTDPYVTQTIACRDGSPARLTVPDPRWFALHKLWMAAQTKRDPLKRPKDRK